MSYGRNTLLFGKLSVQETRFAQDRTFIKLESFGTGGIGNTIAYGMQYVKKVMLGLGKPTNESDFNEKNYSNFQYSFIACYGLSHAQRYAQRLLGRPSVGFKTRVNYAG
ncbi:MAG: hypothetical protein LBD60_03825 [Puniceicoccales bacterium]|nr:hypothetical protein [Puniceicoccales bacterium]